MKRREFITLLGGAVAAWPLPARAEEHGRTYRLGFLLPSSRHGVVDAFFDELRLNGFVEGKNLVVIPGGFEATDDNLAERAAALINAAPDAIVAGPAPPLRALQAITRTVPLVGMALCRQPPTPKRLRSRRFSPLTASLSSFRGKKTGNRGWFTPDGTCERGSAGRLRASSQGDGRAAPAPGQGPPLCVTAPLRYA